MSNRFDLRRARLAGITLATTIAFAALPVAAQAAAVNLGTASPFVVLSGAGVENTGPSVLNGDLGVSPGTSLVGFGAPATVNGATHDNDGVAAQAQADLTTAYNVAAGQAISPGNELTGQNLGGLTLTPGAYGFSSSAEITGQLTLDAQGDPNAQFVFVIGTTLVTESASSVILTNGASPCNVYWKVGSSATFGSTTSFEGNVLALESISVNNGVNVLGRLLARNGEVTLINDVLTRPECATGSTPTPTPTPTPTSGSTSTPTATTPVSSTGGGRKADGKGKRGSKTSVGNGSATLGRGKTTAKGTPVTVHGREIKSVVFTENGKRIPNTSKTGANVPATPGTHVVVAHVKFKDSTKPQTATVTIRVPQPVLHPRHGSSQFTG